MFRFIKKKGCHVNDGPSFVIYCTLYTFFEDFTNFGADLYFIMYALTNDL